MPRIQEARTLGLLCDLHAMIDLSDGLAGDLGHLCAESGVGAELIAERIPIADSVTGPDRVQRALTDGEDFELAFAVPPADGRMLIERQPVPGVTLVHVGEFRAERGIWIVGRSEPAGRWSRKCVCACDSSTDSAVIKSGRCATSRKSSWW